MYIIIIFLVNLHGLGVSDYCSGNILSTRGCECACGCDWTLCGETMWTHGAGNANPSRLQHATYRHGACFSIPNKSFTRKLQWNMVHNSDCISTCAPSTGTDCFQANSWAVYVTWYVTWSCDMTWCHWEHSVLHIVLELVGRRTIPEAVTQG